MIRVVLPPHLRTLAHIDGEVQLEVQGAVTQRSVLDALEARYPMLRGTIREHVTLKRRDFIRFFACEEDLSHESPDAPLPDEVASGKEPFIVLGAIAGGCRLSCNLPRRGEPLAASNNFGCAPSALWYASLVSKRTLKHIPNGQHFHRCGDYRLRKGRTV